AVAPVSMRPASVSDTRPLRRSIWPRFLRPVRRRSKEPSGLVPSESARTWTSTSGVPISSISCSRASACGCAHRGAAAITREALRRGETLALRGLVLGAEAELCIPLEHASCIGGQRRPTLALLAQCGLHHQEAVPHPDDVTSALAPSAGVGRRHIVGREVT